MTPENAVYYLFQTGVVGVFVWYTLRIIDRWQAERKDLMAGWLADRDSQSDKMILLLKEEKTGARSAMADGLEKFEKLDISLGEKLSELADIVKELVHALTLHDETTKDILSNVLRRLDDLGRNKEAA